MQDKPLLLVIRILVGSFLATMYFFVSFVTYKDPCRVLFGDHVFFHGGYVCVSRSIFSRVAIEECGTGTYNSHTVSYRRPP